jgi:hypothetical protein
VGLVQNRAQATFEDNDLRNNETGAWDIALAALPNLKRTGNLES